MDPCLVCASVPERSAIPASIVVDGIAYCEEHMPSPFDRQRVALDKTVDATPETVNHPQHYGGGDNPYEAIKVINAWNLDFELGNTVKYISRAGKKDPAKEIEDLEKAAWYLAHAIKLRKAKR